MNLHLLKVLNVLACKFRPIPDMKHRASLSHSLKNASIHANKVSCQVTMTLPERLMRIVLGEAAGVNNSVFKGRKAGPSCISVSVCPSVSLILFVHLCPDWSHLNVTHKLCPCYKFVKWCLKLFLLFLRVCAGCCSPESPEMWLKEDPCMFGWIWLVSFIYF